MSRDPEYPALFAIEPRRPQTPLASPPTLPLPPHPAGTPTSSRSNGSSRPPALRHVPLRPIPQYPDPTFQLVLQAGERPPLLFSLKNPSFPEYPSPPVVMCAPPSAPAAPARPPPPPAPPPPPPAAPPPRRPLPSSPPHPLPQVPTGTRTTRRSSRVHVRRPPLEPEGGSQGGGSFPYATNSPLVASPSPPSPLHPR